MEDVSVIYAYDTEFLERGPLYPIELLSIGIVCEDGREYYAVNRDADWKAVGEHPWLCRNVVPHLPHVGGVRFSLDGKSARFTLDVEHESVKPREVIAREVRDFLLSHEGDWDPELWADYGAYDHVVLCQLWGKMDDLPDRVPMFTRDVQQEAHQRDLELSEDSGSQYPHHALGDAYGVMRKVSELGLV